MRCSYLALCLLACVPTAGCLWRRNPPYSNAPVLLHYKPTMSDSASILAEQQVRRGPAKPPMPSVVREEEDHAPLPKIVEPAKAEERAPAIPAGPLGAVVPANGAVVRASPLPSSSLPVRPASVAPAPFSPPNARPTEVVSKEAMPKTAAEPQPRRVVNGNYGHDDDYHWLQGVLERHHRGYWSLRYSDPSVEDEFGGKIRLKDDDRLAAFHDGDVIGLSGELLNREANPIYAARDLWLVRQK
jgi:hypothetical protein